ncbi:MAG: hypothetical protein UX47_C0006G0044 [Candidatus Collierbacteria bacterium GW2011_GWA2_46_26]|uniref:Uncharacterized protein n=1 Tax=Candidatus Collierbacteria bacterium GW2011_GWA2_46_26 TaxID=1618381 RepID=A0A0G1RT00_9BACT|nr:MAG: hypothetical protein UX47_C0006G0044 [Candidatus Collierbacteria bacterium GW2011_GWA2_46_26]
MQSSRASATANAVMPKVLSQFRPKSRYLSPRLTPPQPQLPRRWCWDLPLLCSSVEAVSLPSPDVRISYTTRPSTGRVFLFLYSSLFQQTMNGHIDITKPSYNTIIQETTIHQFWFIFLHQVNHRLYRIQSGLRRSGRCTAR